MALDIFAQKLGDLSKPPMQLHAQDEALGQTALTLLDCIQTVVDVMSDPKNGTGYKVSFAAGSSAYTSHKERVIVISAAPLLKAPKGTPLADIAAILTGFAVHEVGHTLRNITQKVSAEWPGKQVPRTLGNIIEDVVLEAAVIERYAGFREVFRPTLVWVAKETCPTFDIPWGTTTGQRVNFIGQVLRYREFVTFASDAASQRELGWFTEWGKRISANTTATEAVELVREALARIHDHTNDEQPEQDEPEPEDGDGDPGEGKGNGEGKDGKPKDTDPSIPEDEPEDGESGEGKGESEESEDDGSPGPGESGDESGEGEGEGSPGDSDEDGEGEGNGGEDSPDGPEHDTDRTADTTDEGRVDLDKGTNDTTGKGGTGQGVAEVGDPDDGFDPYADRPKSYDEASGKGDGSYQDNIVDAAIATERATVRLDAKEHGTLRVIFHD